MMLRIAAIYLIALGVIGIAWPFLSNDLFHPDATPTTFADLITHFAREFCLAALLITGGVGILKKQLWSRKVCLTALGLAFFYGGNIISWQWGGKPTTQMLIASYGLSFMIFGLWFLLLFQKLTEENLTSSK